MAASPLTPEERQRIQALHADGQSLNAIAKQLGRSKATISRNAADMGLEWDRAQTADATKALVADGKARRAELSLKLLEDATRLREQLWQPCKAFNFGGKDNTYNEVQLDEPTFADKLKIMQATGVAVEKHAVLEKLDSSSGADAAKSMLGQLGEALQVAADQINGTTGE